MGHLIPLGVPLRPPITDDELLRSLQSEADFYVAELYAAETPRLDVWARYREVERRIAALTRPPQPSNVVHLAAITRPMSERREA